MPDREVATIRDLIYYQYTTIIVKSAFAAADGESRLKRRGEKKFHDSIPPLRSGTFNNGDPQRPCLFVGAKMVETKNVKGVPKVVPHPAASPICRCRSCSGTADIGDLDGDNVVTVLDIDAVIR